MGGCLEYLKGNEPLLACVLGRYVMWGQCKSCKVMVILNARLRECLLDLPAESLIFFPTTLLEKINIASLCSIWKGQWELSPIFWESLVCMCYVKSLHRKFILMGLIAYTCNPSSCGAKAGVCSVWGPPKLHSKLQASLVYMACPKGSPRETVEAYLFLPHLCI